MRTIFSTFIILLTAAQSLMGQVEEKSFVQSFNLQTRKIVVVDLVGTVQVKEWGNDVMRVQMDVSLIKGVPNTLKGLATTGRYLLRPQLDDDKVRLNAPGMDKKVTYRGITIVEDVQYIICVPVGTIVEDADGNLLSGEAI